METIEIFNSTDFNRAKRVYRNSKVLSKIIRRGGKVNPVTVYVDAIISVCEAVQAFCEYQQEKEKTQQLEFELRAVREEYKNHEEIMKIIEQTLDNKIDGEEKIIKQKLRLEREVLKNHKSIYDQNVKFMRLLKLRLEEFRKEYPYSEQIKDLEKKYLESVTANITASLSIIGG